MHTSPPQLKLTKTDPQPRTLETANYRQKEENRLKATASNKKKESVGMMRKMTFNMTNIVLLHVQNQRKEKELGRKRWH